MKKILIIGAGRSTSYLIRYLLDNAIPYNWQVTVADVSAQLAAQKVRGHERGGAISLDINDEKSREKEIKDANIIVSMLPPSMHFHVAKDCLKYKKHLVTASYVSKEIASLKEEVRKSGLIFLNEAGLDPGIDHMSAMQVIDGIRERGGEIISFKSYCGGLIAPESNDNPWGYKFSWNPRNVVLAGQGTARYIEKGKYRYLPYNRLFLETETIHVDGFGKFEAYANRDSLSYREAYDLKNIPTMLRGTLRMPEFCRAWNAFIKLGWTDDTYIVQHSERLTYNDLLEAFLPSEKQQKSLKSRLATFLEEDENAEVMKKLEWLGLFDNKKILLSDATPAAILQSLLEEKWKLKEEDKDMVVMQHEFIYKENGLERRTVSSLVVNGENQEFTAMAKTVGLPLAISVKLILNEKIKSKGVIIPTLKEIYEPVLAELKGFDINFKES